VDANIVVSFASGSIRLVLGHLRPKDLQSPMKRPEPDLRLLAALVPLLRSEPYVQNLRVRPVADRLGIDTVDLVRRVGQDAIADPALVPPANTTALMRATDETKTV
jgi:hypothetical protein